MQINNPKVERINVEYDHAEPAKRQIEKAMRVCYKSQNKTTETSYDRMYNMAVNSGHWNCLEHGTYYITFTTNNIFETINKVEEFTLFNLFHNDNSVRIYHNKTNHKIVWAVVNGRTLYNISKLIDLNQLNITQTPPKEIYNSKEAEKYGVERITIHMYLDRSIADEFVRHRLLCPLMESSRYVKYKDNNLTFGAPISGISLGENGHLDPLQFSGDSDIMNIITDVYDYTERAYKKLIELKYAPQCARYILPMGYMTHLIMTGFRDDWEHFCNSRMEAGAHPNARVIAQQIKDIIDEDRSNDKQRNKETARIE